LTSALVNREQFFVRGSRRTPDDIRKKSVDHDAGSALLGGAPADVVDDDLPHHARGERAKMRLVSQAAG
jgi:hypothetical protein